MSLQLLDKVRKINKLLHNSETSTFIFNDICEVLAETLSSNVIVISKKGKVLGLGKTAGIRKIQSMLADETGEMIDSVLNERLLEILSTKENVGLGTLGFECKEKDTYFALIEPLMIAGARLGTLFSYRDTEAYDIDDIILSEYGTTVIALEMVRSLDEESAEAERQKKIVKAAFELLASSEIDAVINIFEELDGKEGLLVASKVADRAGITRSVIVTALRKLESAGIIESKSSGMKGTYIKIRNEYLLDELEILKKKNNS